MASTDRREYQQHYVIFTVFAYLLLALNIYYFAHPVFYEMGASHPIARDILRDLRDGGFLKSPYTTKLISLVILLGTHIVKYGSGKNTPWWIVGTMAAVGLTLYLIHPLQFTTYIITTIAGAILITWSTAMAGRNLSGFKKPNNDRLESWQQNTKLIDTPDSINLRLKFKYKGKLRDGWINTLNPFRATLIVGTPGAGKSYTCINQFIKQGVEKGYLLMTYDYKYPDLSKIVYNEYLLKYPAIKNPAHAHDKNQPEYIKDPKAPGFFIINFNDPRYSHRCNPIRHTYIKDPADSAEIADIVMKNVAPQTVEKEDFFSMSAKVYLDAIVYFLSIYEGGKYCTFPHVIEMMGVDYKKVFSILAGYDELETKIKPFASALEAGAQDQLQGQIASATIPLNKMASPALYWVLSGDDFTLDLNDPNDPKFLCIGNDPDRQSIYGTVLALYTSRMFKLINHKKKRKSMIILDELPTVFIKGLDNLIATARSNKVAIVMGIQDESQLIRDYSEKEAKVILNTVGNYFVGNVLGQTAEKMSKTFGGRYREQQSQTLNNDSDSLQISYHKEDVLPVSAITSLSQGYFFGWTADNNDTIVEEKMFYGLLPVNVKEWEERRSKDKPMPKCTSFDEHAIYEECHGEIMSKSILRRWAINQILDKGIIYPGDEMEEKIESLIKTLTKKERNKILDAEAELMIDETVKNVVRENYDRIRDEVREIINRELPTLDDNNDDEPDYNPLDAI